MTLKDFKKLLTLFINFQTNIVSVTQMEIENCCCGNKLLKKEKLYILRQLKMNNIYTCICVYFTTIYRFRF